MFEKMKYVLRLYIAGATPKSKNAIENTKALLEQHFPGNYELSIVDIYQQPSLAEGQQIIGAPTLIKEYPLPRRMFIGDMSLQQPILSALGLS